jgi:hypothetical protein
LRQAHEAAVVTPISRRSCSSAWASTPGSAGRGPIPCRRSRWRRSSPARDGKPYGGGCVARRSHCDSGRRRVVAAIGALSWSRVVPNVAELSQSGRTCHHAGGLSDCSLGRSWSFSVCSPSGFVISRSRVRLPPPAPSVSPSVHERRCGAVPAPRRDDSISLSVWYRWRGHGIPTFRWRR